MASLGPDICTGAKRRSSLPMRTRTFNDIHIESSVVAAPSNRNCEDGQDSGLSSECSTPTGGSPPPRQAKKGDNVIGCGISVPIARAKLDSGGRLLNGRTSRLLRNRSEAESPRSLDTMRTRQISSPLRTPRSVPSPSFDSGDEGSVKIDRTTYQYMFQDIVSLKTMLLKLKRVLQESGENSLMRPETLNPFDNSMKNGLFYNLNEGGTVDVSTSPTNGGNSIADELADLRRQVVFLQGQVEDRDRTIQNLQFQITKLKVANSSGIESVTLINAKKASAADRCNATTQTEKIRPVSAGPSLLQSLPQDSTMGSLVSWSDSRKCQRPSSLAELCRIRSLRRSTDNSSLALKLRHPQHQLVQVNIRKSITTKSVEQENT